MTKATALREINELTDSQAIEGYVLVMSIALGLSGTIDDLDRIIGPLCRIALRILVEAAEEGENPLRGVIH